MLCRFLFTFFLLFLPLTAHAEALVLKEKDCETKLVELIDGAVNYIDVSVYAINNKRLIDALIAAHRRGVKLRVLTDKLQAAGGSSRIWDLIAAGISLRVHTHKRIMHTKVAIYDGISVSSGSLNWTEPAVHKNEEVCDIFVNIPDYAQQHQKLFNQRWSDNPQEKSDEWIQEKVKERAAKRKKIN